MSESNSVLERFHYQVTGPADQTPEAKANRPKLVFLHGVMGFSANWRRVARAFEDRFEVLVFDQRGHGRSFQPTTGYGPENYAQDLHDILAALKWERIHLVGHSMGGRVAYHFAAQYPERVTQLVIEDIGPTLLPLGASLVIRMLDAVPVPFSSKREAKAFFDGPFLELFKDEPKRENLAQYLYANITENDEKEAVWRFYEPGIRESVAQGRAADHWEDIETLRMPTLLMRGEHSKDLPRATFEQMLKRNPTLQGIEIPGAGHWIHSEQPELFIAALRNFLTPLQ
jgi:esterase